MDEIRAADVSRTHQIFVEAGYPHIAEVLMLFNGTGLQAIGGLILDPEKVTKGAFSLEAAKKLQTGTDPTGNHTITILSLTRLAFSLQELNPEKVRAFDRLCAEIMKWENAPKISIHGDADL